MSRLHYQIEERRGGGSQTRIVIALKPENSRRILHSSLARAIIQEGVRALTNKGASGWSFDWAVAFEDQPVAVVYVDQAEPDRDLIRTIYDEAQQELTARMDAAYAHKFNHDVWQALKPKTPVA